MSDLDWSYLTDILISILPGLICITLHELSHGLMAYKLGDNTAKNAGRLTLNPIKHIDIMGLIMIVVMKFGWAKPVPVDMRNFKNPKRGMALTALAGPVSNLVITVVALFLYGLLVIPLQQLGTAGDFITELLYMTAYISLALGVFNMIPIPPLDGSKVLFSFLPDSAYMKLMRYERYGMLAMFALLYLLRNMGINPIGEVTYFLFEKLFGIAYWSFGIAYNIVH